METRAIARGVFEELEVHAAHDALQLLVAGMIPFVARETLRLSDDLLLAASKPLANRPKNVIFRIRLVEITGRFEKRRGCYRGLVPAPHRVRHRTCEAFMGLLMTGIAKSGAAPSS